VAAILVNVLKCGHNFGRGPLEKRGVEIKKKSSPLKLLSQSQPNFAEMILGWSSSKIVPAFQNTDQDGRHS
jgi:hypothetical protein